MTTPYRAVAHPWQCDVLGHLTTRYYVAIFDDASYHFFNDIFGWGGIVDNDNQRSWVDVSHQLAYRHEVQAGSPLEVTATLEKIGNKSLAVSYALKNLASDEIAATLEAIYVLFSLRDRAGLAIDDRLREQATRWLGSGAGSQPE